MITDYLLRTPLDDNHKVVHLRKKDEKLVIGILSWWKDNELGAIPLECFAILALGALCARSQDKDDIARQQDFGRLHCVLCFRKFVRKVKYIYIQYIR